MGLNLLSIVELLFLHVIFGPILLLFLNLIFNTYLRIINLIFIFSFFTALILILFLHDFSNPASINFFFTEILNIIDLNYYVLVDGVSILFISLSNLLLFICISANLKLNYKVKELMIFLSISHLFLIHVFSVVDFFYFYILFEIVLIPMFLIIGIWGSRERKIFAAYKFFLYTLFGSLFMLISIIFCYLLKGSNDLVIFTIEKLNLEGNLLVWLGLFFGFAVKIPIFPLHLWLPEAHVEAPTTGSMLLAGILLKLGGYGLIKFLLPMFSNLLISYLPTVMLIGLFSVIFSSFIIFSQIDIKKIIAYSSIAHMNTVLVSILVKNIQALSGSILTMYSHGLVSTSLFLTVGFLYERFKTRLILYYGGLMRIMPIFSGFFLLFNLANLSLPGMISFIGEFLMLMGIFIRNTLIGVVLSTTMILSAAYSLLLVNRVLSGNVSSFIKYFSDLNYIETLISTILLFFILFLGIWTQPLINLYIGTLFTINFN